MTDYGAAEWWRPLHDPSALALVGLGTDRKFRMMPSKYVSRSWSFDSLRPRTSCALSWNAESRRDAEAEGLEAIKTESRLESTNFAGAAPAIHFYSSRQSLRDPIACMKPRDSNHGGKFLQQQQ